MPYASTRAPFSVSAIFALCVLGCGNAGTGTPPDDGGAPQPAPSADGAPPNQLPGLSAPAGQLALRVDKARQHVTGKRGDALEISLTLANGAGGAPAPLNPLLFQARTQDGLLHASTGAEGQWLDGTPCDPTVQVGAGASATCTIAIDLKGSASPSELRYATPGVLTGTGDARSASAAIAVEACVTCGTSCTYLDRDGDNCGACGNAFPASDVTLQGGGNVTIGLVYVGGAILCDPAFKGPTGGPLTYCASGVDTFGRKGPLCTDLQRDPMNCGACGRPVDGGTCTAGVPSCNAGQSLCGDGCVDLATDTANCGACGKACGPNSTCKNGVITCVQGSLLCNGACVQDSPDNCGSCGRTCKRGAHDTCTGESGGYTCESEIVVDSGCDGACCNSTCISNGFSGCVGFNGITGVCQYVACICAY